MASHSKTPPPATVNHHDMEAVRSPATQSDGCDTTLEVEITNYSKRAQWLRAAVLGANDGLVSTAALMLGVSAVHSDASTMLISGLAALLAGASSMAVGEFVSVYSQYDMELAELKRGGSTVDESMKRGLPSPVRAAAASAAAFAVGAGVPMLAAAFVKEYKVRVAVVVATVSVALVGFGWVAAVLGRAAPVKSAVRVLGGGWLAMGVTFGLTKLVGSKAKGF